MSNLTNTLETKRFVIRKSLIGKNTVITFTNKKQEKVSYNHDEVYNTHKSRFEAMNCFAKSLFFPKGGLVIMQSNLFPFKRSSEIEEVGP